MKAEVHGTILLKRRISLCPRVFVSQPSWRIKSLATHGTVRSTIPGVRESLYIHQQDGFEFLWKTLAGTTDVSELKSTKRKDVGGCIISHAPGTGKIRLSIEEEFKKWKVEFPFHNLCSLEFSGNESKELLKIFPISRNKDNNKVRWEIYTWRKGKSILGLSYNLYEKLAGEEVVANEEAANLKRILLEMPNLVVLDEGHIPRNQTRSIWKTLLKVRIEKRNNFDELFNTLHLVRPEIIEKEKAFADMVSSRGRYSKRPRTSLVKHDSRTKEVDKAIEKIKAIYLPVGINYGPNKSKARLEEREGDASYTRSSRSVSEADNYRYLQQSSQRSKGTACFGKLLLRRDKLSGCFKGSSSRCFLEPSVERQAISRAYRLGQKKAVYTYHLIRSGTNEEDKYCRQVEKDRLSELVFSSLPKENDEPAVPATTFEDMILEKMVTHDDLKDVFQKIIYKPKDANLIETFGLASPA
ncbi:hypothetical protein M9H77_31505 [Catharanthus roseus]|uniref:Uncharacterized protein n=1 Tax=Catharanthus roseus TaxID=4058 RepID=A0ACC0A2M9_CATRO|nr:hypothetical protein M9H77_31505 [Catharanthus roseus]